MIVLVGDVGGTNTRLALAEIVDDRPRIIHEQRLSSTAIPSLGDAIRRYLQANTTPISAAGFGVAAPISAGECAGPNLPWSFSAAELADATGLLTVTLVNDFSALGAGIPFTAAQDLLTLQLGKAVRRGPLAVIGAGTGLGEGFLMWDQNHYTVRASEGGHGTFAPQTEREWKLCQYLQSRFGHVSAERILSGAGLYAVYRFLADVEHHPESSAVAEEMQRSMPQAVITRHAENGTDALCGETVDLFLSIYGAQAGNLALTVLATGGVYIAGGVASYIQKRLQNGVFMQAFLHKGRMENMLTKIPVHLVTSPHTALWGAAALAARGFNP